MRPAQPLPAQPFARGFARLVVLSTTLVACGTAPCPPQQPVGLAPPPPPPPRAASTQAPVRGPEASPVTFERMAKFPDVGWNVPRQISFSSTGLVTFLQSEGGSDEMALYAFDSKKGAPEVLLRASDLAKDDKLDASEELRRERQRTKIRGITGYAWAKKADVLLVPAGGDLFVREASGKVVRLTTTEAAELDPKLCDDGKTALFVRGPELFALDVATRREKQLTKGGKEGLTHGQSDFNGQEEFAESSGYFPSPSCDQVAFLEVDEREVAEAPIAGFRSGTSHLMMQRYPLAGGKNPKVRLGLVERASGATRWVTLPTAQDGERYLGRFRWSPNGSTLFFQAVTRDQQKLALVSVDARTGTAKELASERAPAKGWIDMGDQRALDKDLLWLSAVDGHNHLSLRDASTGNKTRALTSGGWDVFDILAVTSTHVVFTGSLEHPLDRHLYKVPLSGGEPVRLTPEPGVHDVKVKADASGFVDVHSAAQRPPQAVVRGPAGEVLGALPVPMDADLAALGIRPPELVALRARDGTPLYGALLRPREVVPGQRHPVVVMVYGGPGAQLVRNNWAPRLQWQHLADRGFVVFQLDNRGSFGRGPAFETPIRGRLGEVELEDQLLGLDFLATMPFVDAARVGIHGHSYGGFMTLVALLRAPTRFHVGVAGSAVTDWRLYDTGYTERYMGLPKDNPAGYDRADLTRSVSALQGKLLLLHGLMDENVHFDNASKLLQALAAESKPFDLVVFPGERHGTREPKARAYSFRRTVDYFAQHLQAPEARP